MPGGGETQATPTSAKAGTQAQGKRGQPCKVHREGHGGKWCHTAWARKGAKRLEGRPPGTRGEGACIKLQWAGSHLSPSNHPREQMRLSAPL